MKNDNAKIFAWFAFVVTTFWLLGQFAISVGDDLGYMFTDSALHKGDGAMITGVWDCFTTQAKHYLSTNGRFLVHVTTHFFTAIAGMKIFAVVNALMFGVLWLLLVKFVARPVDRGAFASLLALFMLWTCIPDAGTIMLSLVAFAVNYMWTAVAYLAFILLLKKSRDSKKEFRRNYLYYIICGLASIVVGSLQESYCLPISASLFLLGIFNLKRINSLSMTMMICFFVGSCVCVFAPGNWSHAAQGGGFTIDSILRKSGVLSAELLVSVISLLLLILVAVIIVQRKYAMRIIRENAFFLIAILVSLMLAMLTFTSSRQLFCPSLFSIIVIGRIIMRCESHKLFRIVSVVVMSVAMGVILIGGYMLRKNTYEIHSKVLGQLGGKSSVIIADATNANYNNENAGVRFLAQEYAPDPLANETLHLLFDGYTKRGLSRIGWKNHKSTNIKNFIPYPLKTIEQKFADYPEPQLIEKTSKYRAKTVALDAKYKSVRISKSIKKAKDYAPFKAEKSKNMLPYEKVEHNGYFYFVIMNTAPDTIVLR